MFAYLIILFVAIIGPVPMSVQSQSIFFPSNLMVATGIERGVSPFNRFTVAGRQPSFPSAVGVQLSLPSRVSTATTNVGGLNNEAKCEATDGFIYYNGVCSRLLAPCDNNENKWLVVNQHGHPNCLDRSCSRGNILYRGRCILSTEPTACGISEILYVEFTGVAHCDCEPDFIFDRGLRQCIAEHRRGSCPQGQILELKGREITCVPNNCSTDALVFNPADNLCYTKTFEGACLKTKGLTLTFNDNNNTAMCVSTTLRNILEVPALTSCPAGSKRNPTGRCQAVFRTNSPLSMRVPTQHVSRYSVCPPSYSRLPNGSCRKNNVLLSG